MAAITDKVTSERLKVLLIYVPPQKEAINKMAALAAPCPEN
jgi:hypothetical protein